MCILKYIVILVMALLMACTYESKEDIATGLKETDINKLNISQFEGSRSKTSQTQAGLDSQVPDDGSSPKRSGRSKSPTGGCCA